MRSCSVFVQITFAYLDEAHRPVALLTVAKLAIPQTFREQVSQRIFKEARLIAG